MTNFHDFVRVFATLRPVQRNPEKNKTNKREDKVRCENNGIGRMLKVPLLIPRAYISRYSKFFLYLDKLWSYPIISIILTFSRQTQGLYQSSLIFEHISCPQCYNFRILEYRTDVVIIGPKITV